MIFTTLISSLSASAQGISIEHLAMELSPGEEKYCKTVLENEISGIDVEHFILSGSVVRNQHMKKGYRFIYIFLKGSGNVIAKNDTYDIVPETILLPTLVENISIIPAKNETLHFLRISSKLSTQDLEELEEFPEENVQKIYYAKFSDCEPYSETIKSSKTISRTVLPNKYIPRIAMGIVESTGPDKVAPHEHAMLEQLFLGLSDNQIVVTADNVTIDFPAYSLLHIPLGSIHSVEVQKENRLNYMWMDFFLDSKGEEWLKNHKPLNEQ